MCANWLHHIKFRVISTASFAGRPARETDARVNSRPCTMREAICKNQVAHAVTFSNRLKPTRRLFHMGKGTASDANESSEDRELSSRTYARLGPLPTCAVSPQTQFLLVMPRREQREEKSPIYVNVNMWEICCGRTQARAHSVPRLLRDDLDTIEDGILQKLRHQRQQAKKLILWDWPLKFSVPGPFRVTSARWLFSYKVSSRDSLFLRACCQVPGLLPPKANPRSARRHE